MRPVATTGTGGGKAGFEGTPGLQLARNAVLNLAGHAAPAVAALAAIPILARAQGLDRLGVLTIAWALVGYFGALDLGIGRALTHSVAASLGARRSERIPGLVWTASLLLVAVGSLGALVLAALTPRLAASVFDVPDALVGETMTAMYVLACALPFVTLSSGLRGFLEAHQRFDLVNLVRLPTGIMMYLGPVLVLPASKSVVAGITVLAVVRVLSCLAFAWFAARLLPRMRSGRLLPGDAWKVLGRTGAWLTLANLAATALVYLDRLVVGALVPMAVVAYYATPQEVITKLAVIPAAIGGVMFPAFSAELGAGTRLSEFFRRATRYTFLALLPPCLLVAAFAREALGLWLGAGFAAEATAVAQWFSLGILVNGLAIIPLAFLQARGRAAAAAAIQVVEVPVFVAVLWLATSRYGINGAAAAWVLRVLVDTALLFGASRWLAGQPIPARGLTAVALVLVPLSFLIVAVADSLTMRAGVFLSAMAALGIAFFLSADAAERDWCSAAWRKVSAGR